MGRSKGEKSERKIWGEKRGKPVKMRRVEMGKIKEKIKKKICMWEGERG